MKLLAISDTYIPSLYMRQGLDVLGEIGVEVEVRSWEHDTLIELQQANLAIEQDGPEALELPQDLTRDVSQFDMLVVQFAPVSRQLIQRAAALKVIGVVRGGTENVDVRYATERGISVMHTPGRNARAVAECTMGLILAEVRNIARSHACLKNGQWRREYPNTASIPELCGKTVGLVGFGAVGRLVAHYLQAFGSRVVAYDPYAQDGADPVELVDLPTLLRESDVVSIHARLTEDSHHLIGRSELALMKPTAVLVNTARSGLVDERALIEALVEQRIMGAAIDVFDTEPIAPDHPLVQLDNVTITPHLAGSTIDAFRQSPRITAGHFARMLQGESNLPIINGIAPTLG